MQEGMTDYQFETLIKMMIEVIKASNDKQEAVQKLESLLKGKNKDSVLQHGGKGLRGGLATSSIIPQHLPNDKHKLEGDAFGTQGRRR